VKHVYLSPHLDDAVLSCGGTIHRQISAGDEVLIITVFAGEYQGSQPSPFALEQHGYWGNPPLPMALRRAEDVAALDLLGARCQHLDFLDAVYRAGEAGQWLYPDVEALFGPLHPDDALGQNGAQGLAKQLADLIPFDDPLICAPLVVGRHVDHQIVHRATIWLRENGCRLAYYEDYPYAQRPGALESALAIARAQTWYMETISLNAEDLAAKIAAIGCYSTQLSILFGGAEAMPGRVRDFAASRSPQQGLAERIWWPVEA
jgi:LmbE family N-acetylglucosaminyl deacetylase